jgi:vitamin K-dependent gamma-carboxylase
MMWEVYRYLDYGWVQRYWIEPSYHFSYFGWDWLQPWPGDWMYLHFAAMGVLACFIFIGLFYRLSSTLFFLLFTMMFLMEEAQYLNHFYLVALISGVMIFVPAHRALSVDGWLWPEIRAQLAPAWSFWLLRFMIGVPYFFGGIAKLNLDWLQGFPLHAWLGSRTDVPIIGQYFTEPWMVFFFSYSGMLLDLLVVPFLLWRKSRPYAFGFALSFHLLNHRLFNIGIFPWFMIAGTLLFFAPDWPRRIWRALRLPEGTRQPYHPPSLTRQRIILTVLALFVGIQIFLPLRHFLIPGNASWTEEGHRFAWHMKLRSKSADIVFWLTDPATGERWAEDPRDYLTDRQARKMATRPYMIHQFVYFLKDEMAARGISDVEIRVEATAGLNGRAQQLLIDPTVDLAAEPLRGIGWRDDWIIPLYQPLPPISDAAD